MPSKSNSMKAKVSTGRSSTCRKSDSLPKMKPQLPHPHYLVVDTTLPSHIFSDRSFFTTYLPSSKLHRTLFGTDIIIEGIGDVHIRVVASGKSILFCFRDSWHVPSSPHHFPLLFNCNISWKSSYARGSIPSDDFFPSETSYRTEFSKIYAVYTNQ